MARGTILPRLGWIFLGCELYMGPPTRWGLRWQVCLAGHESGSRLSLHVEIQEKILVALSFLLSAFLELANAFAAFFNFGLLQIELLQIALVRFRGLWHPGHVLAHPGLVFLDGLQGSLFQLNFLLRRG